MYTASRIFPPGVGLLPGGENGFGEDGPQKYVLNILADFKPGEEPLTPRLRHSFGSASKAAGSHLRCVLLYEQDSVFRQIYADGHKYPADPDRS